MTSRSAWGVAVALMLPVASAFAFYDTPIIDPPVPTAGEPIGFTIRAGVCDLISAPPVAGIRDRDLTVVGSVVTVTVLAIDANGVGDFCIYPTVTQHFPLASLPAGNYRLDLYRRSTTNQSDVRLATTTAFTVSPSAVPALDSTWLAVLAALLAAFGIGHGRVRRCAGRGAG